VRDGALNRYEVLSIIISCIAAAISLVVWSGQRKLQRESNDLQRATSELAKKQLEIVMREERAKNTARVVLELVREGRSSFRFVITNISDVVARDIELELLLQPGVDNPIIAHEYASKFPAKSLGPRASVSLIAALTLSSPTAFNAALKWTNADGTRTEEETYVAL
jgi:hypothetical protein